MYKELQEEPNTKKIQQTYHVSLSHSFWKLPHLPSSYVIIWIKASWVTQHDCWSETVEIHSGKTSFRPFGPTAGHGEQVMPVLHCENSAVPMFEVNVKK